MAKVPPLPSAIVEAEVALLAGLSKAALKERWRALFGRPAPAYMRQDLLMRGIAYQLQVGAYGGLSAAMKRRLTEIARAAREGTFEASMAGPRIRPGARLIRSWQGTTHSVLVQEDGFEWNGVRYRSLSTIAKAITGTTWNGWTFFGVKRRASRNKNAAGPRRSPRLSPQQTEHRHADL